MIQLMTDIEAAAVIRRSPSFVKRARQEGRLAYIPGRPVMIDEADLRKFISDSKRGGTAPVPMVDQLPEACDQFVRSPDSHPEFMTETEVAALLGKRPSDVARLRLGGSLRWLSGSPALFDRVDVLAWIEGSRPTPERKQEAARQWVRERLRARQRPWLRP